MHFRRYRLMCSFIAIAAFTAAIAIFIFGFSNLDTEMGFLKKTTPYGFILLNVVSILIWQGAGQRGGLIFFIISVPLVMLVSLGLNSLAYNFQIMVMIAVTAPSYLFYRNNNAFLLGESERIDSIEEEQNLLNDSLKKDAEVAEALYFKLDRYNLLKALGETFNAKLSLQDSYRLTIDKSYEIIPRADEVKLFLVPTDGQELELCSWKFKDNREDFYKKADIFDKWVFDKRRSLHINDIAADFRFDYHNKPDKLRINSLIIVPLIIQHRIIGILRVGSREKDAYAADDLRLLDFISDLASAAINNARLYIQTQELAITDGLTGLYVYRYFKERLREEFNRCNNSKENLSVFMLDIDHFKDYNDKYGHAAGDKVLKDISDIIRKRTLKTHILARYGGEEFVVLLPQEGKKEAESVAERIRKDVEAASFVLRRKETKTTVSAGVASFPLDAPDEEELLKRVDFLLYKAKKEGRNRVCAN